MGDNRLFRIFAWTIGVLIVLWMLTECLGGVDPADPRDLQPDRNGDQYAADCDRAWQEHPRPAPAPTMWGPQEGAVVVAGLLALAGLHLLVRHELVEVVEALVVAQSASAR